MKRQITMLLTNGFDPDVRVYKEAVYLVSRGWSVTILCWDRDPARGYPEEETTDGVHLVRFPIASVAGSGNQQLPAFFRYIRACRAYLKERPCDCLHCHDIDGALAGYLARRGGTPMVFDMHEFYERGSGLKRKIWRYLTLFLLRRSAAAVCVSIRYLSPPYTAACPRLYPLRNYPDAAMIEARPKSESPVFRVGYHGVVRGQVPEFTALFDAVRDLPDVRVDINGGGIDLPALKEAAKGIPNVYLHGPFDGRTASSGLYEATDVLFCGYDPGNPNYQGDTEVVKFYEAIFTGTPMIMTKGIGMGEKVERLGFGLTCDTRDPAAIRAAVLKLKEDRSLWWTCAENELARAGDYDWRTAVKVLDKIYQK